MGWKKKSKVRKSIIIVGGGPIGLLSAIDARRAFGKKASVRIVEMRQESTRGNVPALDTDVHKHLKGIGFDTKNKTFALSELETELEKIAVANDVEIMRGYNVHAMIGHDKQNGRYGRVTLLVKPWANKLQPGKDGESSLRFLGKVAAPKYMIGKDKTAKVTTPATGGTEPGGTWSVGDRQQFEREQGAATMLPADIVVVASGGAAARDPAVLRLFGITYSTLAPKTMGAYALFEKGGTAPADTTLKQQVKPVSDMVKGGPIRLNADAHDYVLVNLAGASPKDIQILKTQTGKLKNLLLGVSAANLGQLAPRFKDAETSVGHFEIEIRRADCTLSREYPVVVVGDAAATPHPQAGTGIKAGLWGVKALGPLFEAIAATDGDPATSTTAFMDFMDRYELYVSEKALEGTYIVIRDQLHLLKNFLADLNQYFAQATHPQVRAQMEKQKKDAEALQSGLQQAETKATAWLQQMGMDVASGGVTGSPTTKISWSDTVKGLWDQLKALNDGVQKVTANYSRIEQHIDSVERALTTKGVKTY